MDPVASRFLQLSARHLRDNVFPRIREAVERLSDEDIWWRPGDSSNSVGNLLLHLAGNVRQHVVAGAGGAADYRDRPAEFAATGGFPRAELVQRLAATVNEAAAVLERLPPNALLETRTIQGKEVVLLDDIYHVIEHFSYHAGQIIDRVKARTGQGFPWYAHLDPRSSSSTPGHASGAARDPAR